MYELTREVGKKTSELEVLKNDQEKNIKMIKDRTKVYNFNLAIYLYFYFIMYFFLNLNY